MKESSIYKAALVAYLLAWHFYGIWLIGKPTSCAVFSSEVYIQIPVVMLPSALLAYLSGRAEVTGVGKEE